MYTIRISFLVPGRWLYSYHLMEVSHHLLIDIASPVYLDGNAKEPDYMSICYSDGLRWSGTLRMFSLQSYVQG